MTADTRPELTDQLIGLYCDWRNECVGVQAAYEQFAAASASARARAFEAYEAALDREESAADAYAAQVRHVAPAHPHTKPPMFSLPTAGNAVDT